jgi:hypothetical protein
VVTEQRTADPQTLCEVWSGHLAFRRQAPDDREPDRIGQGRHDRNVISRCARSHRTILPTVVDHAKGKTVKKAVVK